MPVTITINEHTAQTVSFESKPTAQAFAADVRRKTDIRLQRSAETRTRLLASSLNTRALSQLIPTKNGFVDTCITAYNQHHHLIVRPDDIWLSIITQFNFYVNGHSEDLRHKFISPKKRKKITMMVNGDNWMSDSTWITKSFVHSMRRVLRDKALADWLLPAFSTTTKADALCASIIMMGTLQSYYAYEEMPLCGIPAVTLEGCRADYYDIEQRLNRLAEFGEETYVWGEMLRPIIRRFIRAFDGESHEIFWNQICHRTPARCGEEHYTGWITAFCPFDEKGRWQLYVPSVPAHIGHLYVDEIQYQALPIDKVPWGFCQVDFDVIDDGHRMEATFVAGLMGQRVCNAPPGSQSMLQLDINEPNICIAPHPAWFIFEKVPLVLGPAHYPDELENLQQYLRTIKYSESALSTGVPVLNVPSVMMSSPIEFSAKSERSDASHWGESTHRSASASPTSSPTGNRERDGPRRLRKDRPLESPTKEPSSWMFPSRRRPLAPLHAS